MILISPSIAGDLAVPVLTLRDVKTRLEKSKLVSKPSTRNRFSKIVTRFHIFYFFSPIRAKVQTNKQTNLRSPAGRTRLWITGIFYAATVLSLLHRLNRKLRWFDSWVFDVRRCCTSAHFPINRLLPPAVTGGQGAR